MKKLFIYGNYILIIIVVINIDSISCLLILLIKNAFIIFIGIFLCLKRIKHNLAFIRAVIINIFRLFKMLTLIHRMGLFL